MSAAQKCRCMAIDEARRSDARCIGKAKHSLGRAESWDLERDQKRERGVPDVSAKGRRRAGEWD